MGENCNIGILIFKLNIENDKFSGVNGFVNKRPYIVINSKEKTTLFEQLTYRAVLEGSISVQKGAELLEKSYMEVENACFLDGGW